MTIALSKQTVRKAISAHSALGLICCALLYLICATGTAIVLYEEWQRLEQHDAPEMASSSCVVPFSTRFSTLSNLTPALATSEPQFS